MVTLLREIFQCILIHSPSAELLVAIARTCRAGAKAVRNIRNIISFQNPFVTCEKNSWGQQSYLTNSKLLHGLWQVAGLPAVFYCYGKPVHFDRER
jgi:hypothetical protein